MLLFFFFSDFLTRQNFEYMYAAKRIVATVKQFNKPGLNYWNLSYVKLFSWFKEHLQQVLFKQDKNQQLFSFWIIHKKWLSSELVAVHNVDVSKRSDNTFQVIFLSFSQLLACKSTILIIVTKNFTAINIYSNSSIFALLQIDFAIARKNWYFQSSLLKTKITKTKHLNSLSSLF